MGLTAAASFNVDYNLWYAPTYVAYENGAISSFATHQTNIPSAKHDLYRKPSFVYADTSALLADNTGLLCPKVKGIDRDVNGKLRVAQTLRGAYTNELPSMNGALNDFANLPATTLITDTVRPQVVIMNAGTDTLREATIRVELDGIVQGRDLIWKGQLAVGETDVVSIGSFILKNGSHRFKAYLTGIGNMKDTIPEDDTISTVTYTCSGLMAGSYTVGSNNADFSTPNDAIKMLTLCGVSAPVTLKLQAGKYGPIGISGTVPGSSATNTITVMPESGAKVVIDGGAVKAFTLHNSANWHFRNITFGNTTDATVGVELNGKVENVSFRHCNIYASTSATTSSYYAVSYPNTSGNSFYPVDVEFVGNNIKGGYYNMYLYYLAGSTTNMTASTITVDSNTLSDAYYYGIYAYYYAHYKSMSHNTITNRKNCTNIYYGIYNYYYSNVDKFEGNRIHVTTSNTGYGMYWYYYKNYASYGGTPGSMVNNEIIVEGNGGTKYGVYFYYPYQNWDLFHNSIFVKSTSGAVYGMYAYNGSSTYKINMKNNLFVSQSTGTSYPIYLNGNYTSAYVTLDYNNYYSYSGTYIGYTGSGVTTLAAWKSATGMDQHSVSAQTSFVDSTKSLELDNYEPFVCPRDASVMTDINGKSRTSYTTMGAHGIAIKEDVDLQMLAFLSPEPITDVTCFPTSMPVKIKFRNGGLKKADFTRSALKISMDITGAINHHFDTTITTGNMAFQQTDSMLLCQIPTVVSGVYRIKVTLNDTSDTDLSNDSMSLIYKVGRVELPYDVDFSTEPNEFINVTMAGTTEWKVVKGNGSNPTIAPAFGTGRLEFAGEKDPGAYAHAIFNGVNIQGCVNPILSFWYAHSATCTKNDMLAVLVTTDGGANFTEVKRVLTADTVTAWKKYEIDLSAFTKSNCLSIVFRAMSFGDANQSIDRIQITADQDAELTLLPIDISERSACDNTPVDIKAVINNLSRLNIDMLNDTLTLNVTGAVNYSNKVVYNSRLGDFESDTVTLGQISLDANGAYYFNAWMQSFDDKSQNDTTSDSTLFIM
ncbi:MAG: hypothetical protein J6T56_04705, partial [Bacteroidales bacterium]|nr:hypothetical protein [Bacteroidales bacterium]